MLEALINFSQMMDAGIFAALNQMVSVAWGAGWYFIILIPLMFLFGVKGIQYAMGDYDGDKLKGELVKLRNSLILLPVGFFGLPLVESLANYLNTVVQNNIADAPKRLYEINKQAYSEGTKQFVMMLENARELDGGDEEVNKFINSLSSHSKILFDQIVLDAAKSQSMTLSEHEVTELQEVITNSGVTSGKVKDALAKGFSDAEVAFRAANNLEQYQDLDPKKLSSELADISIWHPLTDIIAWIFLVVGNFFKIVILFVRGSLIFVFWIAFPITVALSFVPTMEDSVKEWWSNYKPLVLMLITITLIEALTNLTWIITRGGVTVPYAGITNAMCAFVSGILFLMAPSITVMLFGGGAAFGGIGQQVTTGGAAMLGGAALVKGALFGGKDKQGNQKSGLLSPLGKGAGLFADYLKNRSWDNNQQPPSGGGAPIV